MSIKAQCARLRKMHGIPFTATHDVHMEQLLIEDPQKHDPFSLKPVDQMNNPVEIGEWVEDPEMPDGRRFQGMNHIYNIDTVNEWMRREHVDDEGQPIIPIDRLTGLPFQWKSFDPVRWTGPLPHHLVDTNYVKVTEDYISALRRMQEDPDNYLEDFHLPALKDFYQLYHDGRTNFRRRMAKQTWNQSQNRTDTLEWIADYWRHHPHNEDDEQNEVRTPNRAVTAQRGSPGQTMPPQNPASRNDFRKQMAEFLDAQKLQRQNVLQYWKYHPIDPSIDSEEVVAAYNENKDKRQVVGLLPEKRGRSACSDDFSGRQERRLW